MSRDPMSPGVVIETPRHNPETNRLHCSRCDRQIATGQTNCICGAILFVNGWHNA